MISSKVTIILATHNRAHLIAETLRSIQNQKYSYFECLIIDDSGNDNTEEVVAVFLEDKRFLYRKRTEQYKKGLPGCRNFGLDHSNGDYIIFFDDDDIVHPQNLEICVDILSKNKASYFCHYQKQSFSNEFDYNQIKVISEFNQTRTDENIIEKVVKNEISLASCTVLWRKECFSDIFFNEKLQYAEEWECYQRILSTYWNGIILDCVLYFNRKHPESNTGEFWKGNEQRMHSKIQAAKLIITNLEGKKILTSSLVKYFSWESARLNSPDLFSHLMKQPSLTSTQLLQENLRYYGSPLIRIILRLKKQLR